jgi:hypothetical protein
MLDNQFANDQIAKDNATRSTDKNLWWERCLAILIAVNFGWVLFDLSYIPWRNLYFRYLPALTKVYDPVKGIEPHRETTKYLATVDRLADRLADRLQQQNPTSPAAQLILKELADQSIQTIETNPFQGAGKSGALEKIKNRLRDHMGKESSKEAFRAFWSPANFTGTKSAKEMTFFNQQIRPLFAINYFREIGEDGEPIDHFWLIDLGFGAVFLLDLLLRLQRMRRRNPRLTWRSALIDRWYDLLLFLPLFRLLRVFPFVIRWHQARLINLDQIQHQVNTKFVNEFADELTQVVINQVLNQAQGAIKSGTATQLITTRLLRPYVDLNDVNEVEAIAQIILEIAIYRVLPKIQPDLEEIISTLVQKASIDSPAFQNLKLIPGFAEAPHQLIDQVVRQVSEALYIGLTKSLNDPQNGKLAKRLAENFMEALGAELQKGQTVSKLESLIVDMLAEMKASYTDLPPVR